MALDDIINKEEPIAGKPFSINPESAYDRKEFVSMANDLFDLEEYYGKLMQNSGDGSALNDLVGLASGYIEGDDEYKKQWIAQAKQNPHLALSRGDKYLSYGYVNMAKFVENNRIKLLKKMSDKQLYSLFLNPGVTLYKTGEEKHDRIADLRAKMMAIQQASEKGEDIGSIIESEMKELIGSMSPENQAYLSENDHLVIPGLKGVLVRRLQTRFASLFKDKDGKIDKTELIKYLERNYQVVEDDIDDIPADNEKEKFKRWDKNLKMQYVEIARALLKPEKADQKKEDDPEGEDRKTNAKEKGLAA